MKGMVIRMNANKKSTHSAQKPHRRWLIFWNTGLLCAMAVSLLVSCASCTGGPEKNDGTVADSNVGSVTSSPTDKATEKRTEKVTEKVTEMPTAGEQQSGTATMPGIGTMPGTEAESRVETSTSAATTAPGTGTGMRGRRGYVNGK